LFRVKIVNFFANFLGENILKITTSIPGHLGGHAVSAFRDNMATVGNVLGSSKLEERIQKPSAGKTSGFVNVYITFRAARTAGIE
jgi:hypothetical protein